MLRMPGNAFDCGSVSSSAPCVSVMFPELVKEENTLKQKSSANWRAMAPNGLSKMLQSVATIKAVRHITYKMYTYLLYIYSDWKSVVCTRTSITRTGELA